MMCFIKEEWVNDFDEGGKELWCEGGGGVNGF